MSFLPLVIPSESDALLNEILSIQYLFTLSCCFSAYYVFYKVYSLAESH